MLRHPQLKISDLRQPSLGKRITGPGLDHAEPLHRVVLEEAIQERRSVVRGFYWHIADVQQARQPVGGSVGQR
jgi:hypothetical protein